MGCVYYLLLPISILNPNLLKILYKINHILSAFMPDNLILNILSLKLALPGDLLYFEFEAGIDHLPFVMNS